MIGRRPYLRAQSILGITSIASSNEERVSLGNLPGSRFLDFMELEISHVSSVAGYVASAVDTSRGTGSRADRVRLW